jgi:hypothetical protein
MTTIKTKSAPKKPGEVQSLSVEKANNGYIVHVYRKPPRQSGDKQCCGPYCDPECKVFANTAEVGKYFDEVFGSK